MCLNQECIFWFGFQETIFQLLVDLRYIVIRCEFSLRLWNWIRYVFIFLPPAYFGMLKNIVAINMEWNEFLFINPYWMWNQRKGVIINGNVCQGLTKLYTAYRYCFSRWTMLCYSFKQTLTTHSHLADSSKWFKNSSIQWLYIFFCICSNVKMNLINNQLSAIVDILWIFRYMDKN